MKNTVVIIIAIAILVVAFFVFTNTPLFLKSYSVAKTGFGEVSGPLLRTIGKPVELVGYIFKNYIGLIRTNKENAELRNKLARLQMENQKISELEHENKRLKNVLNLMEQRPKTMIAARVVGEDIKNWFKCIILDKGKSSGITN